MTSSPCACAALSASSTSSAVIEKRLRGESSRRLISGKSATTSRAASGCAASRSRPNSAPQHSWGYVSAPCARIFRSEEHTSELQSRVDLVCRLLLEKKKKKTKK